MVNPEYIATPSDRSNAAHGAVVLCGNVFRLLVEVGILAARGVLVVPVECGGEIALRNAQGRFHFRHRLIAVDELDQLHLGHLHVRLIDDEVCLLVGLLEHVRRCARMVGILGNEPLSLVVDDDAGEQDFGWVRRPR